MDDVLPPLSPAEVRVLGSLVEKAITTPDHYPLTLAALTAACNQLSNREPVVSYDKKEVVRALDGLREKHLATLFHGADDRVPKYKHALTEVYPLAPGELALLCVLMLRGPQTIGELRTRTERLHVFRMLADVETGLQAMSLRQPPLVTKLPRQIGLKEPRYAHLLSGPIEPAATESSPPLEPATLAVRNEDERIAKLEAQTASLRRELADLQHEVEELKKQWQ
jgi:uncharacterized protein YceH (UPF0502 family)